jgi:hypothetical protein
MINPSSLGVAGLALALVLMSPAGGLAQNRSNERVNEHASVPPRPPMKATPLVTMPPPAAPAYRNAAPVPPATAFRRFDHDRDHDHDRDRGAFAAGVAAGVVLGGALAAPGIYNVPAPSPADDAIAYCTQTYSSYDPQSGTYIGDDGNPHPCPP